ncbi:MAG: FAD-dependent oxidoreductase [Verrucomicrobia bacterium]|nr:FAD-dependent oxidoreductase [Verrucomicrobiota bacterium]
MGKGHHSDVIVIGGGVIGVACAYYLSKAGRHVRILERETIGAGASHANCGLIVPSHVFPMCLPGTMQKALKWMLRGDSPLYIRPTFNPRLIGWLLRFGARCNTQDMHIAARARIAMLDHSMTLYRRLIEDEKLDCDWEEKGLLFACRTEKAMDEYALTASLMEPYGVAAKRLNQVELQALEPALRDDLVGGWHHQDDAHLRPERLMSEWRRALDGDVQFEEQCTVTRMDLNPDGVHAVDTPRGPFTADAIVLATGAWAPQLAGPLGLNLPVEPGKGYSITMTRPAVCPAIPVLFCERKSVATPWASGYRLGGTMEFSGYREGLNHVRLDALRAAGRAYLKDPLGDETVEEWYGFRPMTYDGIPVISRAPRHPNVYIAAGHNMIGISAAPASGHLIADLITEREPIMDPAPFSIQRFQ